MIIRSFFFLLLPSLSLFCHALSLPLRYTSSMHQTYACYKKCGATLLYILGSVNIMCMQTNINADKQLDALLGYCSNPEKYEQKEKKDKLKHAWRVKQKSLKSDQKIKREMDPVDLNLVREWTSPVLKVSVKGKVKKKCKNKWIWTFIPSATHH